jgi:hypothetical protein
LLEASPPLAHAIFRKSEPRATTTPSATASLVDLIAGRVYIPFAMTVRVTALVVSLFAATLVAQQSTDKAQPPKGQMPELGRPTKVGDELPLFDFDDYFAGRWTFEWDTPDGVLGESGHVTGTTIYKVIEPGTIYQADTSATGPSGAFTIREQFRYQKDEKTIARQVTDSRGFAYTQTGTIGGDLGGIYNILFDGAPFTYGGHSVRIKQTIRTMSPFNYKVATTVSVDGGPFRNYGNPWWRKDAGVPNK